MNIMKEQSIEYFNETGVYLEPGTKGFNKLSNGIYSNHFKVNDILDKNDASKLKEKDEKEMFDEQVTHYKSLSYERKFRPYLNK